MERAPPSCSAESDAIEPAPQHRGRSSEKSMHRTLARRRAIASLFELFHQRVYDIGLGHFSQDLAAFEHDARAGTARHAKVGVGGFARTVHNAAHNGDLHRLDAVRKALVNLLREVDEIHLGSDRMWGSL